MSNTDDSRPTPGPEATPSQAPTEAVPTWAAPYPTIDDSDRQQPPSDPTAPPEPAPEPPTYAAPEPPVYSAPEPPRYAAPEQPTYSAPEPPAYTPQPSSAQSPPYVTPGAPAPTPYPAQPAAYPQPAAYQPNPYAQPAPYQPNPTGQPPVYGGYAAPPSAYAAPREQNTSAIVLTIVSGLLAFSCYFSLAGIPSLILGIIALTKQGTDIEGSRRMSKIGWIVLAVVGALCVLTIIGFIVFAAVSTKSYSSSYNY